MRYDQPELRDRLAAEYALGTLQGRARRRLEKLMRSDRSLREAIAEWQDRLSPLASALEPVEPSPGLLGEIEKRIGLSPLPVARAAAAPVTPAAKLRGWWERWFGVPPLAMAAVGLFLGVAVSQLAPVMNAMLNPSAVQETQLPQSYAGILSDAQGRPTMLVSSLRHGSIADIKVLAPISLPPGSELYLWAFPTEGAPFVIGAVPAAGKGSVRMKGTSEQLLSKVTVLGVSIEPAGAPPAQPSQLLLRGPCAKFW